MRQTFFQHQQRFHKRPIENFQKKQTQIDEARKYLKSIALKNRQIEIEFENDDMLARLEVSIVDTTTRSVINPKTGTVFYPYFLEFGLKTNSQKIDSIVKSIGWISATLANLKD